jgi:hypothetical protein
MQPTPADTIGGFVKGTDAVPKYIPDGYTAITPYLVIKDVAKEIAFLKQAASPCTPSWRSTVPAS